MVYGLGSNGQLIKANGRTTDSIEIVQNCEKAVSAAYTKSTKRWWEVWK